MEGDDFKTVSGLIEATGSAFANTWKAQPTCNDKVDRLEDPCTLSVESGKDAKYSSIFYILHLIELQTVCIEK